MYTTDFDKKIKDMGFLKGNVAKPSRSLEKGVSNYTLVYFQDIGKYTTLFVEGRTTIYQEFGSHRKQVKTYSSIRFTFYKSSYNPKFKQMNNTKVYCVDVDSIELLKRLENYLFFIHHNRLVK